MKKSAAYQIVLSIIFVFFLALAWLPIQAQEENLLTNPGFESPFVQSSGSPPPRVAQGWTPWYVSAGTGQSSSENVQPEYFPASEAASAVGAGVPQIRSGSDAQQYFSFFATHDGGVFQRVTGIPSGAELRFTIYAYVWSTTFDDPSFSEEDGDVILQVGIDPTGGTDGDSENIVWSSAAELYDDFNEYTVTTRASGSAVTVFVRSTVGFPVKSNSIYLDDASLVVIGGGQTPTSTSTNTRVPVVPSATPTTPAPTVVSSLPTNTPTTPAPTAIGIVPTNTPTVPPASLVAPTFTFTPTTPPPPTNTVVVVPVEPSNTPTIPPASLVAPTFTFTPSFTPSPTLTFTPTFTATEGLPPPPSATPVAQVPTVTPITQPSPTTSDAGTGGPDTVNPDFPGTIIHTVRSGDTVAKLAVFYGSTSQSIIEANGLNENALIFVGQGLVIPVRLPPPQTSTPTNTPIVVVITATPGVPVVPTQPPPTTTQYVVQRGDTLSRIAARFNTTVAAIAQLNGIVNPNVIQVGQRLVIPGTGGVVVTPPPVVVPTTQPIPAPTIPPVVAPRTYTVQAGDNLYRISLRFGVSMARLVQANNLFNANIIYVGQVLIIP